LYLNCKDAIVITMKIPIFLIFYNTTFSLLVLALFVLILITPADAIQQALNNNQLYNVFVVAGGYVLTGLIALLVYASRLYTNRAILAGIPDAWVAVDESSVKPIVWRMIRKGIGRSALIAWAARPKDSRIDADIPTKMRRNSQGEKEAKRKKRTSKGTQKKLERIMTEREDRGTPHRLPSGLYRQKEKMKFKLAARKHAEKLSTSLEGDSEPFISTSRATPVWGPIAHPGWSPPCSSDLPNLHYDTVIMELPHLIEAKAVSLAPVDPLATPVVSPGGPLSSHPPATPGLEPNPTALEKLIRPPQIGLREYVSHIINLGLIENVETGKTFVDLYEQARFSGQPLVEADFRRLTGSFAEILRGMNEVPKEIIDELIVPDPEDGSDSAFSPGGGQLPDTYDSSSLHTSSSRDSHKISPTSRQKTLDRGRSLWLKSRASASAPTLGDDVERSSDVAMSDHASSSESENDGQSSYYQTIYSTNSRSRTRNPSRMSSRPRTTRALSSMTYYTVLSRPSEVASQHTGNSGDGGDEASLSVDNFEMDGGHATASGDPRESAEKEEEGSGSDSGSVLRTPLPTFTQSKPRPFNADQRGIPDADTTSLASSTGSVIKSPPPIAPLFPPPTGQLSGAGRSAESFARTRPSDELGEDRSDDDDANLDAPNLGLALAQTWETTESPGGSRYISDPRLRRVG
jgi:hypothetical protein